ncbi:sensor histidine kinase [Nonomuraea purpurea]|uniref:histidine kinase n=1 Tax=Nonomuraea purpurea TaxID=1849276 RepID=A0ABV8GMD4_9ACTN
MRWGPVPLDVLLAAGGLALSVLTTWGIWHTGAQPAAVTGLFAVVGGLSLGVARRLPHLVVVFLGALLVAADTFLSAAVDTYLILTLVAIGISATRVTSSAWTAAVYLGGCLLIASVVIESPGRVTLFRVMVIMTLVALPIVIGRYLGARRATEEAERLRAEELARAAVARARADHAAEREHIVRDVHDIVARHIGAMVLRAGAARHTAPDGPIGNALTDIRETGHQVLQDLRDLLHDPHGRPDPAEAVRECADRMSAAGLLIDLDLDPATGSAPRGTRASAARIVQEGLTNVLKHAGPGTRVRVRVARSGDGLDVRIHNEPPPTAGERLPASGHGLAGMRERVHTHGGTLTAGPDGAGGWLLTAHLPGDDQPN